MLLRNTIQFFRLKPVVAVGFLFATSSLLVAVWASALPFIKLRLGLNDSQLGLLLLFAPLGSIVGVLTSTTVFSKIKIGSWLGMGNLAQCTLFCLEVYSPNVIWFSGALFLRGYFGFLNGVANNMVASRLENEYNRKFLSTCHAMYSIGGAIGAAYTAILFGFEIKSLYQILGMYALVTITVFSLRPFYLKHDYFIHSKSGFKLPNKSILGLSFICMVIFMTEGSIVDWSSIYMKRELLAPLFYISLGYGGFSVAMTLGRLNGDIIIPKLGDKKIIIYGSLIAAFGILMVAINSIIPLVIFGFILTGIGCCCIVPVLFATASKIPNVPAVQGYGMITTGGLVGFLAGPSIIGFISEQYTLSLGFIFTFILLLFAAFAGYRNRYLG
jgi:hypothetical protein